MTTDRYQDPKTLMIIASRCSKFITMDPRNAVEGSNSVDLRNAFSRAKPTSVVGRRAEDICSR
jgi:hypothetical protein